MFLEFFSKTTFMFLMWQIYGVEHNRRKVEVQIMILLRFLYPGFTEAYMTVLLLVFSAIQVAFRQMKFAVGCSLLLMFVEVHECLDRCCG